MVAAGAAVASRSSFFLAGAARLIDWESNSTVPSTCFSLHLKLLAGESNSTVSTCFSLYLKLLAFFLLGASPRSQGLAIGCLALWHPLQCGCVPGAWQTPLVVLLPVAKDPVAFGWPKQPCGWPNQPHKHRDRNRDEICSGLRATPGWHTRLTQKTNHLHRMT